MLDLRGGDLLAAIFLIVLVASVCITIIASLDYDLRMKGRQ